MTDELERRLMEALDARSRPADDAALADALTDPSFARKAAEFESLEGWLREWETRSPSDAEFDALARRIEQRLGESFDDADFTQPPVFDDPDARVRTLKGGVSSGSYSLSALTAPAAAAPTAGVTGPGPAVLLGEKRRASRAPLFLAAAAVVGLAVTAGVATLQSADEPLMASAEMADAVSAAPTSAPALESPAEWAEEEAEHLDPSEDPMAEPAVAEPEMDLGYALADGALDEGASGSAFETTRRARPRTVPTHDGFVPGRGGSAFGNDGLGGAPVGSAMATKTGGAAPPFAPASASDREASTGGESSLDDRLRACAGASVPARLSLQLTLVDRRVTAVRVRSPTSLTSQSPCFVRALRDERFDGGPRIERTYRLSH